MSSLDDDNSWLPVNRKLLTTLNLISFHFETLQEDLNVVLDTVDIMMLIGFLILHNFKVPKSKLFAQLGVAFIMPNLQEFLI